MITDFYTKSILTIIAISLAIIAFQSSISTSNANTSYPDGIYHIAYCWDGATITKGKSGDWVINTNTRCNGKSY